MLVRVPDISVELFFVNRRLMADTLSRIWSAEGEVDQRVPLSAGDVAAIEDLLHTYLPLRESATAQAAAARDRGDATFTLELDLSPRAVDDIDYVVRLLARVEELSGQQSEALPAPPELRGFRIQLIAAIAEQLRPEGPSAPA